MATSESAFWSTLARKLFLAVTGLCLFGFVCVHLAGNLLLFVGADAFNQYSHKLISLGPALYVIETILALIFLIHMYTAITVTWGNWSARTSRYAKSVSRGGPSHLTISSKTMIWTGLLLLAFTIVHLVTFKYGPGISEGYVTTIDGQQVRDLYRLVVESFRNPLYSLYYVVSMAFLGFHLRHGFWSAIQSLGGYHPRLTPVVYGLGLVAAIVLGVGFLVIPVWFFFGGSAI